MPVAEPPFVGLLPDPPPASSPSGTILNRRLLALQHPQRRLLSEAERDAVCRAIHERRNGRVQLLPVAVPEQVLARLLAAAHAATSVGVS